MGLVDAFSMHVYLYQHKQEYVATTSAGELEDEVEVRWWMGQKDEELHARHKVHVR